MTFVLFNVPLHSLLPFLHSLQTFHSNIDCSQLQKIRLICNLHHRSNTKFWMNEEKEEGGGGGGGSSKGQDILGREGMDG